MQRGYRRSSDLAGWALVGAIALTAAPAAQSARDWSRFRGPIGSGVSTSRNVPTEFGR